MELIMRRIRPVSRRCRLRASQAFAETSWSATTAATIIKQRLLAFHGDDHYVGMDFADPPVDFAGIAKSLGLEAIRITEPGELKTKLSSAFGPSRRETDRGRGRRRGARPSLRAKLPD
jgi:hypothetical protein